MKKRPSSNIYKRKVLQKLEKQKASLKKKKVDVSNKKQVNYENAVINMYKSNLMERITQLHSINKLYIECVLDFVNVINIFNGNDFLL